MTVSPCALVAALAFYGLTSAIDIGDVPGYGSLHNVKDRLLGPGQRFSLETLSVQSKEWVDMRWEQAVLENNVLPHFVPEGLDNPVLHTNIKDAYHKDDEIKIRIDRSRDPARQYLARSFVAGDTGSCQRPPDRPGRLLCVSVSDRTVDGENYRAVYSLSFRKGDFAIHTSDELLTQDNTQLSELANGHGFVGSKWVYLRPLKKGLLPVWYGLQILRIEGDKMEQLPVDLQALFLHMYFQRMQKTQPWQHTYPILRTLTSKPFFFDDVEIEALDNHTLKVTFHEDMQGRRALVGPVKDTVDQLIVQATGTRLDSYVFYEHENERLEVNMAWDRDDFTAFHQRGSLNLDGIKASIIDVPDDYGVSHAGKLYLLGASGRTFEFGMTLYKDRRAVTLPVLDILKGLPDPSWSRN